MKFGILFDTHVDKWDLIRYAEALGYDAAWVPDSQMIWSDCYAIIALAAAGIHEIAFLPPADHQGKVYRDLAEMVMPACQ